MVIELKPTMKGVRGWPFCAVSEGNRGEVVQRRPLGFQVTPYKSMDVATIGGEKHSLSPSLCDIVENTLDGFVVLVHINVPIRNCDSCC